MYISGAPGFLLHQAVHSLHRQCAGRGKVRTKYLAQALKTVKSTIDTMGTSDKISVELRDRLRFAIAEVRCTLLHQGSSMWWCKAKSLSALDQSIRALPVRSDSIDYSGLQSMKRSPDEQRLATLMKLQAPGMYEAHYQAAWGGLQKPR